VTEIIRTTDLPDDVAARAMAAKWVAGANAQASRVAPCLTADDPPPTEDQLAEAQLVLIGAVIRWSQAGSGALQAETIGPLARTVDTRQRVGFRLWPSDITQLQDICKDGSESKAFAIDTVPCVGFHSPICSIYFGGGACSCGASIAGQPIYEHD
jgi:hypothetical protein